MSMVPVKGVGFGGSGTPDYVPAALAELQGLTASLVVGAAANTAIAVPDILPEDTVVSVLNMTDLVTIPPANVSTSGGQASGTMQVLAGVVTNDKVTINGKIYTFKAVPINPSQNYPPGVVPIATPAVANDAAKALSKAIASADSTLQTTVATNVVTIKARTPGTAGNAITLDATQSNGHCVRSGATLTGGTAATGIKITTDTSAKKLLVLWFDKRK
jgi:phage tail sheath gpL-like